MNSFTKRELVFVKEIEQILGYTFKNKKLIIEALTHKSFYNVLKKLGRKPYNYERLEFLGDAVLELVSSEYIFNKYPQLDEGTMSRLRASVVNTNILARVIQDLQINRLIIMGRGEAKNKGVTKPHILAAVFESITGALYIDGGIRVCKRWIKTSLLDKYVEEVFVQGTYIDPKTLLQEYTQRLWGVLPSYDVLSKEGKEHERVYTVCVKIQDKLENVGRGSSIKEAEMIAATHALKSLKKQTKIINKKKDVKNKINSLRQKK